MRTFQNVDIAVEDVDGGTVRATVIGSPVGAGARTSFHPDEAWSSGRALRRDPRVVGQALFDAVFVGELLEAWRGSQEVAWSRGEGLRLRLRLADAPEVTSLPWELLYDPAGAGVGSTGPITVVRYRDLATPSRPRSVGGPLRVLVALSSPVPLAELDVDAEWRLLRDAVAGPVRRETLIIDRLPVPTVQALVDWLRNHDVNVLHVVAHGDVDEQQPDGVLYFCDAYGRPIPVPASMLAALVHDHDPLQLVVLDVSASGRPDDLDPNRAVADRLLGDGCAGVVTLDPRAGDHAGAVVVGELYESLAGGLPVDWAMTHARRALLGGRADAWATPILYLTSPDGRIFDHIHAPDPVADAAHEPARAATPPTSIVVGPPLELPGRAPPEPPPAPMSARSLSPWSALRGAIGHLFGGRDEEAVGDRTAYPRIEVRAGRRGRPDVVVVEEPFEVVVGLGRFRDTALIQTSRLRFAAGASVPLELVLTFDPTSLHTDGRTRLTLRITEADPYPTARLTFTARYRPNLPAERRIGVQFVRDGQVVGVAWRPFVAVLRAKDVAGARPPAPQRRQQLDLQPLLGSERPDLVLSVCASDGAATGEFVWTAYARSTDVVVPDAPRVSGLEDDLQRFVAGMRDVVAYAEDPYAAYLSLVGKATKLGRAVPSGIASVVRRVVEDPSRREAATVLLLTEELALPWELAVFDPPLETPWGGVSPFLGAHAAIARWPLTQREPRPTPRSTVAVRRAAVLAADYAGAAGWSRLDHAVAEAQLVAALFAPPAVTIAPSLRDVVGLFRGVPRADVVHVALHGQFDASGTAEGLVLLDTGGSVGTTQFLTPDQVETGRLDGGPFVFLNACQVGSDKRILGDYGGFASTLLRIGATGVVAPLWNVDDDVAAAFAQAFYAATWTGVGPTSVAEAVRALRARYTEAAAEAHTEGITPTLIAFQVFGHPRLRLTHV